MSLNTLLWLWTLFSLSQCVHAHVLSFFLYLLRLTSLSPIFVIRVPQQIAFRVYTESLWYPGRQFNLINAKQQIPRKSYADLSAAAAAGSSVGKEGTLSGGGTPMKCTT